jgi:protein gp37
MPASPFGFVRDVFDVIRETPRHTYQLLTKRSLRLRRMSSNLDWPENLWMGVSVEDATRLERLDDLRATDAAVKFLSAEPLLGPLTGLNLTGIDWVITGGESGAQARPCEAAWVRDIRDRCSHDDVAFFHKQWGGRRAKAGGRSLDGRTWDEMPGGLFRLV